MTESTHRPNDLLLLAGKLLALFMQAIMVIAALGLLVATPAIVIWRADLVADLAGELGPRATEFPLVSAVAVMLLALVAVVLVFLFFGKLRRIIATVGEGDPFAPENASRLSAMAWLMLAIQLIGIPIAGIGMMVADWAESADNISLTFDAGIDLTGILMVVILFILARVFRHGAAMREDLEGTV